MGCLKIKIRLRVTTVVNRKGIQHEQDKGFLSETDSLTRLISYMCRGFYPIALCIPRVIKGKTGGCINLGLDIIRVCAEKD